MKQLNEKTGNQVNSVSEETITLTAEQTSKLVADETLSKSNRMIQLYNAGYQIKRIAELMGTRYNFAYNVISNFTRVNDLTLRTKGNDDSKKQAIVELVKQGKSNTEISKALKTNYNYVYKVTKEFLKSNQIKA